MTLRRRKLLMGFAATLAAPALALAQSTRPAPRVAVLVSGSRESHGPYLEAFVRAMHELGYVDGKTVVYEVRWAEGRSERLAEIAGELIRLKPDVIVANGTAPIHAVGAATTNIPVVMASVGDPVGQGLVSSLARPGGNITGNSILTEAVVPKMLELVRDVLPKASRVAAIMNPSSAITAILWKEMQTAAGKLGMTLLRFDASTPEELDKALAAIAQQRPHALITHQNTLFNVSRRRIIEFAARNRIPAALPFSDSVVEGGLLSYTADLTDSWRNSAKYVHRILKGAKPGDLPVEQATRLQLFVNLKTAKALGITIPPSVLLRADRVIE